MSTAGLAAANDAPEAASPDSDEQWWALQRQPSQAWATFLCVLPFLIILYGLWVVARVWTLVGQDVRHEPHSSIDARWLHALLPALYVPATIVWAYVNWVGWQFFHHN